jgi:hypothetical protein
MNAIRVPRGLSQANGFGRDVLAAYREAVRRYGSQLWVTGITIGVKEVGGEVDRSFGPVIAIHVRKKAKKVPQAHRIPRQILGVPTDVIEATYTPAASGLAGSALPSFPLRSGASYARFNGSAATLSGVVRDSADVRYLLSAAHTILEGSNPRKGDLMVHPGPADSQQPVGVARHEKVSLGMDAGISRLEPGIQVVNRALLSNVQILPPVLPQMFDVVEKSGRSTGIRRGEVRHIGVINGVFPAMRVALRPQDDTPISELGDSGAIWYDTTTFAAKGLHVSADLAANPPAAVAGLVFEITKRFKVTWV